VVLSLVDIGRDTSTFRATPFAAPNARIRRHEATATSARGFKALIRSSFAMSRDTDTMPRMVTALRNLVAEPRR
jgi:hypothetical protein